MQRLLIADSSEIYATVLARSFRDDMTVRVCTDGMELPALLHKFRPDALFLNLHLPRKDGITALREASYLPPVILATANYMSAGIQRAAMEAGATHVIPMPAASAAASNLRFLMAQQAPAQPSVREQAALLLQDLGFAPHLDGTRQLLLAIPLHAKDPKQPLGKFVYPAVAEEFGQISQENVAHSIRNAIAAAWKSRDPAVWSDYFPGCHKCPSNKVFLSNIVLLLKK